MADKFNFQRTLRGTQNEWYPSSIIYEPKYITKMSDYIKITLLDGCIRIKISSLPCNHRMEDLQ